MDYSSQLEARDRSAEWTIRVGERHIAGAAFGAPDNATHLAMDEFAIAGNWLGTQLAQSFGDPFGLPLASTLTGRQSDG